MKPSSRVSARRLDPHPLIDSSLDDSLGANINGPSLIRVPDWVRTPLGRYYLYFAHHEGAFIRMAYADTPTGPFTVHRPGVLTLAETPFFGHIASPDVHVDHARQRIWMHYHGAGLTLPNALPFSQTTCYAESTDGLAFRSDAVYLAESYLRTFEWKGWYYGFSAGALRFLSRSREPNQPFERGPVLGIDGEEFTDFRCEGEPIQPGPVRRMRHVGLIRKGEWLHLFYSNVGDCPERIRRSVVKLSDDWNAWRGETFEEVLEPETLAEGAEQRLVPSEAGACNQPVNELRDPFLFDEDGKYFLFYTVAGEKGIAVAEVVI